LSRQAFPSIETGLKSMLRRTFLAVVAAATLAATANATLVAEWNFNSLSIPVASAPGSGGVPTSIAATTGTGSLSLAGWTGLVDDFAGSGLNALPGTPAEESLSLVSNTGNGSYVQLSFTMTALKDLTVSFATRGTSTGYNTGSWSYSTDGISFLPIVGVNTATTSTTFGVASFTTSLLDYADTAFLRYTLSGATTASGNNRIDNLQLNAIPEPTAALFGSLLAGAFGLTVARRPAGRE
jgi:hypothetical protein